jgi:tetratricopeptide (TPR) repeat protein
VRVCRSAPPTRRQRFNIYFQVNQVHLLTRVFSVLGIFLSLALLSLPLFSQTSLDTNPLNEPRVSGIGESHSEGPSPYVISVSHLRVPEKAAAHLEAAQKRFAKMQLAQATMEIDRALEIYPGFAQAFRMKALVNLAEKDFTGSVESAAHAIRLDGADAYSWVALATAYNSLNEWSEAEAAAGQALALDPSAWQGRLELAKSFYGQREYGLALNTINQITKDFPDVHLIRANVLVRLGRTTEATEQFRFFMRQAPNDARCSRIKEIGASDSTISIGK